MRTDSLTTTHRLLSLAQQIAISDAAEIRAIAAVLQVRVAARAVRCTLRAIAAFAAYGARRLTRASKRAICVAVSRAGKSAQCALARRACSGQNCSRARLFKLATHQLHRETRETRQIMHTCCVEYSKVRQPSVGSCRQRRKRSPRAQELAASQDKAAAETLAERPRQLATLLRQCQLQSGVSDQAVRKLGADLEMVMALHQLSQLQVNCALLPPFMPGGAYAAPLHCFAPPARGYDASTRARSPSGFDARAHLGTRTARASTARIGAHMWLVPCVLLGATPASSHGMPHAVKLARGPHRRLAPCLQLSPTRIAASTP